MFRRKYLLICIFMIDPHPYSSTLDRGGGSRHGCILLSHEGFVDHRRAMKEAPENEYCYYFCWFGIHTDSHFSRKEIQALPSTHGALKAISPSVKWLKPSPAEQLPAFSQRPPTDTPAPSSPPLSRHQSQPLSGPPLHPEPTGARLCSGM